MKVSDFEMPAGVRPPLPEPSPAHSLRAYREAAAELRKVAFEDRAARVLELNRVRRRFADSVGLSLVREALDPAAGMTPALLRFWLNHFSVFWAKDAVAAALSSFVDDAVRPRLQSRFRDLLLAATLHPAMLVYLDNASNSVGRINENHARELLELHTLGADGGYQQSDVGELARVMTGFGLQPLTPVAWPPALQGLVRENGEFLFDPRRHERAAKTLLGVRIEPGGFAELEGALDLLCRQEATARHVVRRMCVAFIADRPSEGSVRAVTAAWLDSGGQLGEVVQALRRAAELSHDAVPSFKDPWRWLISSLRLLLAGRPAVNSEPVLAWLSALGQRPFFRTTPDGYPLPGAAWASPGQLAQRAAMAHGIVDRVPAIAEQEITPEALLEQPSVRDAVAALAPATRAVLDRARTPRQRLALLLASPEFSHWLPSEGFA